MKSLILAAILLCASLQPALAAAVLVQHKTCDGTPDFNATSSMTCSFTSTPTAGNAVLVHVLTWPDAASGVTALTVTDNQGNTYTQIQSVDDGAYQTGAHRNLSVASSGTFTVTLGWTWTGGGSFTGAAGIELLEYSGLAGTTDGSNSTSATSTTNPFNCTGLATANANDLVIAFAAVSLNLNTTPITAGSGYTVEYYQQAGGTQFTFAGIDRSVSATGTYTPSFGYTGSNSTTKHCIVAAFPITTQSGKLLKSIN